MINLTEVDSVEIVLVMDNSIDILLPSSENAKRFPLGPNPFDKPLPFAEHGFSALIRASKGDKTAAVLFDTGVSRKGILHNLDALEVNCTELQAIILSHGHADHAMGLPGLIDRLSLRHLPLVLHPDAYLERKIKLPNGEELRIPPPNKQDFQKESIEIIEETGPSMLIDNMVLVSGEVSRTTEFERGFPSHFAKRKGEWTPDPLIMDDQCAIVNVRNKGLVVITGCGHSGIINTLLHAQSLTGVNKIYAALGGFHLSGKIFEPIIPSTIDGLKKISPTYLMPGHCSGWKAMHQIARELPDAFIPNSVGTTLRL